MVENYEGALAVESTSLARTTARRKRIIAILVPHAGSTMGMREITAIASALCKALKYGGSKQTEEEAGTPGVDLFYDAVVETLIAEAQEKVMGPKLMRRLAIRIAGNIEALRLGQVIFPWAGQGIPEQVLAAVIGADTTSTPKKKIPGGRFTLEILTGTPAGMTLEQFMPESMIDKTAELVGVRKKRDLRRVHPRELVGCVLRVQVREGNELRVDRVDTASGLTAANKALTRARDTETRVCPYEFRWACHFCPAGWSGDHPCQLATQRVELTQRSCRNGHTGFIDLEHPESPCMACQERLWRE